MNGYNCGSVLFVLLFELVKKSTILFLSSYKVVNSLIVRVKSIGWESKEYGMYLKLMSMFS